MTVFIERVNSVPTQKENFSVEFESWLQNLVDSINTAIEQIEEELNAP